MMNSECITFGRKLILETSSNMMAREELIAEQWKTRIGKLSIEN